MSNGIDSDVIADVRNLYQTDEIAQRFLDDCATRQRDASATSVDRIGSKLGISRERAIQLARDLDQAGCGKFMLGRRGYSSRLVWDYSCISIGQAAAGETTSLEEPSNAVEEVAVIGNPITDLPDTALTIAQAKEGLSLGLGVPADKIEITVRG